MCLPTVWRDCYICESLGIAGTEFSQSACQGMASCRCCRPKRLEPSKTFCCIALEFCPAGKDVSLDDSHVCRRYSSVRIEMKAAFVLAPPSEQVVQSGRAKPTNGKNPTRLNVTCGVNAMAGQRRNPRGADPRNPATCDWKPVEVVRKLFVATLFVKALQPSRPFGR